jgi:hypothetical protein
VYQDNKSTILLATNGRASSSRNTKHIRNRFFLVKDLCDRSEIQIRHEGTETMWSDVLTKPKQGTPFKKMRAELMNCEVNYNDETERLKTHPKLLPVDNSPQASSIGTITANEGVINAELAGARVRIGKANHPRSRRSVLGKSRIAQSTRSILRIGKWGESARAGRRANRQDSNKKAERLTPISVPGLVCRSDRIPTSRPRGRPRV